MNKTDALLWNVLESLESDFRKDLLQTGEHDLHLDLFRTVVKSRDYKELRSFKFPSFLSWSPFKSKRLYQLQSFMKRWCLEEDVLSAEARTTNTVLDFIQTQRSDVLATLPADPISTRVLAGAQKVCLSILGSYSEDEHQERCRFGSKAAYNLPATSAYMHNRIPRLSATAAQMYRWSGWLERDPGLAESYAKYKAQFCTTDHLILTVVPKSYKIGRAIVPDTILGGFIANGLGDIIADRLKVNAGLDIRKKQSEHQYLARKASRTGHLTTADMSKASDRISWTLLQRVLPSDWLQIIEVDRIHRVQVTHPNNQDLVYIETVHSPLLMGKGYTFPLQTLVFYSLLISIRDAVGRKGYISVYGDDLIYPTWMHKYVVRIFPQLGLRLNEEKTFSSEPSAQLRSEVGCFRESCGGDFLCGFSIRPYSPKGSHGDVITRGSLGYAEFCFKLLNGLLSRWKWHEILTTVRFLLREATLQIGFLPIIPPTAGDGCGLKYDWSLVGYLERYEPLWPIRMPYTRRTVTGTSYSDDAYCWMIREQRQKEIVPDESIYLWDALRIAHLKSLVVVPPSLQKYAAIPGYLDERVALWAKQLQWEEPTPALMIRPCDRSSAGERYRREHPTEPYPVETVVDSKDKALCRLQIRLERINAIDWSLRD